MLKALKRIGEVLDHLTGGHDIDARGVRELVHSQPWGRVHIGTRGVYSKLTQALDRTPLATPVIQDRSPLTAPGKDKQPKSLDYTPIHDRIVSVPILMTVVSFMIGEQKVAALTFIVSNVPSGYVDRTPRTLQ